MSQVQGGTYRIVLTNTVHYFRCNYCGLCCEGPVELTERDYERIMKLAEQLNVKPIIEVKHQQDRVRRVMKPIQINDLVQECAFLVKDGDRRICRIYEQRPCYCRLYPIFIGISHILGEVYVDFLHCPGVTHTEQTGYTKLDAENVKETLMKTLEYDPEFIKIIPNMDRAVVFALTAKHRELYVMWSLKYHIVKELNEILLRELETCENFLQVLYTLARFQHKVNAGLKSVSSIFELPKEVEKERSCRHIRIDDVWKGIRQSLELAEVVVGNDIVLLDNYYRDVYAVEMSLASLREVNVNDLNSDMFREIFMRFSCNFQTCALPLDMMYIKGYAIILLIYCLYRSTCEDTVAALYNFDAVGLAVYTRYVNKLLGSMNLGYINISTGFRF